MVVQHLSSRVSVILFSGVGLTLVGVGCMRDIDAETARQQFSSKQQSIVTVDGAQASQQGSTRTPASIPALATGPVSLAEPSLANPAAERAHIVSQLASTQLKDAQSLLRTAARSAWAAIRAHAIEASVGNPELLTELAPAALADENRGVRFVVCMAIAEAPSEGLSVFVQPLLQDESASVRASATLALTRCGKTPDPSPIAAMIFENDPEVRANAYLVLGELGNRSAVPMIRDSLGQGLSLVNPLRVRLIDLAAAEALVKLGDQHEIEPIRAALFAPPEQAELTIVACGALGRLQDEVARPMLERLLSVDGNSKRSPEIRLSAALSLMEIGASPDMAILVAKEYITNSDARVRALVASLLGKTRSPEAVASLASLIRDSDPTVQVAAAGGLELAD